MQEDELELDIDELSDEVLHKLLLFVRKHAPHSDDAPARPAPAASSAAPTRKKNKPMSKTEQEARIAQVQSGLSAFQKGGTAPHCKLPFEDAYTWIGAYPWMQMRSQWQVRKAVERTRAPRVRRSEGDRHERQ